MAWYRQRCTAADATLPPGAVIGLAECGNRADAGLLRPLLAHPAAGVRSRAMAGLWTLDCVDAKQLRPLLDDPAAGVVRETTAALLPSAKELPADWLLEAGLSTGGAVVVEPRAAARQFSPPIGPARGSGPRKASQAFRWPGLPLNRRGPVVPRAAQPLLSGRRPGQEALARARTTLWPPKPKEWLTAIRTSCRRGSLVTQSMSNPGAGASRFATGGTVLC